MSERRRGLGRGLGALIPPAPVRGEGLPSPLDTLIPDRQRTDAAVHPAQDVGRDGVVATAAAAAQAPDVPRPSAPEVPPSSAPSEDAMVDGPEAPSATESPEVPAAAAVGDPADPARAGAARPASSEAGAPSPSGMPPAGAASERTVARETLAGAEELVAPPGAYFAEVPVEAITPNPRQPRQVFDEEAMAELVHSIREIGLLQPVVVRPLGPDRYELVMGERRWRAAAQAGLTAVPAIVRATEDADLLRDALLENLHRSELNPLEEAAAYDQLLQDFGCTHEELAERIGRSRPQISNTLRLLRLPPSVQRRVAAGVLSAGHAKAVLGLEDAEAMERLAQRIVAEGLSVRAAEEIVALGDVGRPSRRPRRAGPGGRQFEELAGRLADRFDTRVKVDLGRTRGKIVVEFATLDDLQRIVAVMAPDTLDGALGPLPGAGDATRSDAGSTGNGQPSVDAARDGSGEDARWG